LMNWRVLTAINALIAIVTISAVAYAVSHIRRSHAERRSTGAELHSRNQRAATLPHTNSFRDITDVRVDKLASVLSSELYEVLSRATPEQIAALALKFNDLSYDAPTLGAVGTFFQTWANIDGKAALTAAFRLRDLRLKRAAADAVVESASPSLCGELAIQLRDHPDADLLSESKGAFLDVLLPKWALADAPAAAKFFDNLGDAQKALSYETDNKIGRAWATVDPYKALAWADKHTYPTSNDQDVLFSETIAGWSAIDMPAAANYVAQHMGRQGAKEAADAIVAAMLNQDGNGSRAAKWLSNLPSSLRKKEIQGNFAYVWAETDPQACARWVETLPEDEKPAAVNGLMIAWPAKNWNDASKWIGTVSGQLRDEAIASAINTSGFENISAPEAISLALSVTDRELRLNAITDAVSHWAIEDREAAVAWLKRSSLSPREKRAVMSLDVISPRKPEQESDESLDQ
jgi:hypothetical protein